MGQPITWKNVGATVSGNAAGETMEGGVKTVMGAFDPLKRLQKEAQDISDQNEVQRGVNLNTAEQERVQNIGSLAEYNQMKDSGQFDDAAARDRLGYQYDAAGAQKARETQLGVLRKEAVNSAMPGAYEAADRDLDLTGGVHFLRESLEAADMVPEEIAKRESAFLRDNTARQAEYTKTMEDNLTKHLSEIGAFKSPAGIADHIDSLGDRPGFDHNKLAKRLTTEMVNNQTHLSYTQKQDEIKRINTERTLTDKTYNTIIANVTSSGSTDNVYTDIKNSGLSASAQMNLTAKIMPMLEQQAGMKGQQTIEYNAKVQAMTREKQTADAADQNQLTTLTTAYNNAIGWDPTSEKVIDAAKINGTHLYDLVLGDMQKTSGFWGSFFNVDVKSDKTAMMVIDTELKKLVNGIPAKGDKPALAKVNAKDAERIIYTAMQNTKAVNQYVAFPGSGVHKTKFNKEVEKLYNKYIAEESQRANITQFSTDMATDAQNRQNAITRKQSAMVSAYGSTNLGKPTSPEQAEQSLYSNVPSVGVGTAGENLRVNLETRRKGRQAKTDKEAEGKLTKAAEEKAKNELGADPTKWDVSDAGGDQTYEQKGLDEQIAESKESFTKGGQTIKDVITGIGKGLQNKKDQLTGTGNKLISAAVDQQKKNYSNFIKSDKYVTVNGEKRLMTDAENKLFLKAAKQK